MKKTFPFIILLFTGATSTAQNNPAVDKKDTGVEYKKRVLDATEIDLLTSFYGQNGDHAAVTGGVGTEKLTDFATNINVSIPLNADDVLTIDGTVSAYTSASSSNLNPFYSPASLGGSIISGASRSGRNNSRPGNDDDDDNRSGVSGSAGTIIGSPWVASSGASRSDVWTNGNLSYNHTSDNRNTSYGGNLSVSHEYDYGSFGAGLSLNHQFNQKNTELGLKGNIYLDRWYPQYPTELKTYIENRGNLNADYFTGVDILNENGQAINKLSASAWNPLNNFLITTDKRKTFSASLSFSQIVNKNSQFSIFSDFILQRGWLSNPMQRVYFSDRNNFYIGTASSIKNYDQPTNRNVFQLADDIERLPDSRTKIPIGLRYHYYINEQFVIRAYYRYYFDDWGIIAHTVNLELPIKISDNFTLYPNYRYYTQTAARYFAPYEQHLSTEQYYTSDYDLSAFNANQYGIGIKYTDVLMEGHRGILGLKNLSLNYNLYSRSNGLKAHIISLGAKFVLDK